MRLYCNTEWKLFFYLVDFLRRRRNPRVVHSLSVITRIRTPTQYLVGGNRLTSSRQGRHSVNCSVLPGIDFHTHFVLSHPAHVLSMQSAALSPCGGLAASASPSVLLLPSGDAGAAAAVRPRPSVRPSALFRLRISSSTCSSGRLAPPRRESAGECTSATVRPRPPVRPSVSERLARSVTSLSCTQEVRRR